MPQILIFIILAVLSAIGVSLAGRYAEHRQVIAHPTKESSHSVPIPQGGGLAIVFLVLVTGVCVGAEAGWNRSLVYLVLGAVMAWIGWRDDVHSLPASYRFIVQGLVAAVSMFGFGYFKVVTIPLFGDLNLGIVGVGITFLWIVGMINAYNFMDGIDGMAGGVALAGGLGWMMLAFNVHNNFVFWIALATAASSLGFLWHNWSPAKIFMGDVSSTFLGYTFAVLPLLSSDQGGDALLLGTLLMWLVIADPFFTFLQRLLRGDNILARHRMHVFTRLVAGGYKHTTVSSLYISLTLLAGVLAYFLSRGEDVVQPLVIVGLPLIWIWMSVYAARLKNGK